MNQAYAITQIIISILLVILILLQAQGTGLGTNWTGGGETYHTRKGVEKVVFITTIVGVCLFILLSIASLML
ncbi:MAG TPA: preprotein translocase subunit SecG [Candidatus Woesebacteria bacterium]|nr:preprotein translocase subunit SecG [Candidatus Woesebacteria bacterium]